MLGVERYGTVNFVQNIVQYFIFFAMMGITHIGVRQIAKQKNQTDKNKCYSSLFVLNVIYTAVALSLYIPLIFLVNRFSETKELFLLGGLQILFNTFTIEWFFRGTEDFKYITIRSIVVKIIYVLLLFIFVHRPKDYIIFYALTVLMTGINAIINYTYAGEKIKFSLRGINIRQYFKSTLSLGIYSILTSMYTTLNVAILGLCWDDIQVGYYTTAIKLYTIILGFYSAFTGVMLPRMTSLLGQGDEDSFHRMIDKSFNLLFTIALPMVFVLFMLSPELILLLAGDEYLPAINMSRIVIPMLLVVGMAQLLSFQILLPKGYDRYTLHASIIGAIVGVSANMLLTTKYAAIGTCITVVITEICVTSYYFFICRKKHLFGSDIFRTLIKHIVVSLPYLGICYIPKLLFGESIFLILGVSSILCIIYFVISQMFILKNDVVLNLYSSIFK
ncbi:MAG: flippase [Clostridia bacterium]|nr:flippase [Clostridia bacterium]